LAIASVMQNESIKYANKRSDFPWVLSYRGKGGCWWLTSITSPILTRGSCTTYSAPYFFSLHFLNLQVSASCSKQFKVSGDHIPSPPAAIMLSRISTRIVPYRVLSRLDHPFPRSRIPLQNHQSSHQIGIRNFSTTRPWFKKHRKGDIVGRLLSASGILSREQEKEIERIEELADRMGMGGYYPLANVLAVILWLITVLLPIGVGLMCVRWILRKIGVLQDPQVAKEAKNYGVVNDDNQYGEEE
jgi:hypothetical protein